MLQKLEQLLTANKTVPAPGNNHTFLSVIGRSYDEDLISRVVAYCLSSDQDLIRQLIENYIAKQGKPFFIDLSSLKDVSVFTEKTMGVGRADIFVTLTDVNNHLITITIENKILTHEHTTDERFQTQVYYDWVTHNHPYTDAYNIFYYLRPDYNSSSAQCIAYENLTYTSLLGMLGDSEDPIIQDFKAHITYALGRSNMVFDSSERLLLNNFKDFEVLRAEATRKVRAYQDMLLQKVAAGLEMRIIDWRKSQEGATADLLYELKNSGAGIGAYRLYHKDWYKPNEHYFFVEIIFDCGCMDRVYFQCTLRDDEKSKDGHKVPMFLHNKPDIKIHDNQHVIYDNHYIINQHTFFESDWGTPEWETRFVKAAVQYLKSYITEMQQIFTEYQNFAHPKQ